MNKPIYNEVDFLDFHNIFDQNWILIVTATDLETEQLHCHLTPLNGGENILKAFQGDLTYYFGVLGKYKIVHVQSSMGSISRNSSIMTVSTAQSLLKLKVVIMIGIAFGVDSSKQNIGDVLVSESIIPYNVKRVGKSESIQRGIEAPASKILLNRFKNIKPTWEHFVADGIKGKLIPTRLLSGEELVDNIEHRDELLAINPDSNGGEMEGAGLYAACDGKADWIVIKGICDFADGEKGHNKTERQTTAIKSAISACLQVFNSNTAFRELKVIPEYSKEPMIKAPSNIDEVLFDIYDIEKEQYYIIREPDSVFDLNSKQYGLWIYGPTGCGKSNLILRNLLFGHKQFIQIGLATSIGLSIESLFIEILYELASKVEGVHSIVQPKNFSECTKELLAMLEKHFKDKELIIFIEEIPISTENDYRDFSGKFFSLLISKNLLTSLSNVKFILSSINNPTKYIQNFQQKIHQQFKFIALEYWLKEDIENLVNKIVSEFSFNLPFEFKEELIKKSCGSPRFVKKFFRSLYTLNKTDAKTIAYVLTETERELSQYCNA